MASKLSVALCTCSSWGGYGHVLYSVPDSLIFLFSPPNPCLIPFSSSFIPFLLTWEALSYPLKTFSSLGSTSFAPQSVVCGSAVPASPEILLEMQSLSPHSDFLNQKPLFKDLQVIHMHINFEKYCSRAGGSKTFLYRFR